MIRFIVVSLLLICASSCSTVTFVQNGNKNFYVSLKNGSEKVIERELNLDFYFWGLLPSQQIIDLQESYLDSGISSPSNLRIEKITSFKSIFWATVTLGLYLPETYKVSAHSKVERKNE